MATLPPQPGSIEFLHYFVQNGIAGGQISVLKGPETGVTTQGEILNAQRYSCTQTSSTLTGLLSSSRSLFGF